MKENKVYLEKINELIDEVLQKEEMIQRLINYIARNSKKTTAICEKNKYGICSKESCKKCIREYAERKYQ